MPYETLLVERKDQVTTITLNRPKSKNAMNPQMHFDMCDALAEVERDDECRVLVLACAKEVFRVDQNLRLEDALLWETAKWTELDAVGKKTWHKGVKQFKEERRYRPGLETYQWKE